MQPPSWTLCAALVVLSSWLVPTAGAEPGVFDHAEVFLAPERFAAALYGERFEGEDAHALRGEIDAEHGDGDGNVTQEEADAYEAAAREALNARLRQFGTSLVSRITVNERAPLEVRVTALEVDAGALGPLDGATPVLRNVYAEIIYPSTARDRVDVAFGQNFQHAFPTMRWGYAVFAGHAEWSIDADTIEPATVRDEFWAEDRFNVTYDRTGEFSGIETLEFELYDTTKTEAAGEKGKSPAPGASLVVLFAVVLVALGRQVRHAKHSSSRRNAP